MNEERAGTGRLWRLSYPVILAGVGEVLIDVTDAIFLAHYGLIELGAVAVADAFYEMLLVGVLGLVEGIQILSAHRAGRADTRAVGAAFRQGLMLLALVACAVFAVVQLVAPALLSAIVDSTAVEGAARSFLRVISFGVVFEAANLAFGALYVSIGRTRVLFAATLVLTTVNVLLDYALVFGHFGLPELGISGAALASVIAEGACLAFLVGFAFARGDARRYRLFSSWRWRPATARRLVALSTPAALEALVTAARWFVFFLVVERIGEEALAHSNIVYSAFTVLVIPIEGISETVTSLVGRTLGRGRGAELAHLVRRATFLGLALTLPAFALAIVFPETALWIFDDGALAAACVTELRVVALALLLVAPGEMLLAAVSGTGDTRGSLLVEAAAAAGSLAWAATAALALDLSLAFVWLYVPLGWMLRTVLAYRRLHSETWREIAV